MGLFIGKLSLILIVFTGFQSQVLGKSLDQVEIDLLNSLLAEKSYERENDDIIVMDEATVRKECLAAHNKVRAYHDARPLTWDETHADKVTPSEWAEKLAGSRTIMHDRDTKLGENLAMVRQFSYKTDKPTLPCAEAVYEWYQGVKDYREEGLSRKSGHFTQLVWKATTKLNCGVAYTMEGPVKIWYIVCRYYVPGNIIGEFQKNVSAKDLNLLHQLKSGADLV